MRGLNILAGLIVGFTLGGACTADRTRVSPAATGANAMFNMAGLYYGTLPASHPESRRAEFAKLLQDREIRLLRFPGGTLGNSSFLADNDEVMRSVLGASGYPEGDPNKFVTLWQFLDFCKETGTIPVFHVNMLLHTDGEKVYQLTEAGSTESLVPPTVQLDPAKRADAAEALTRLVVKVREKGFSLNHWELGNEEYGYPRMKPSDYADIAIRFIRAIRQADAQAMIWVTLGSNFCSESDRQTIPPWSQEVLAQLRKAGLTDDKNLGFTLHYVWPEYIHAYTDMVKRFGFKPRFAVTEFHMAGLGDYSDLCPRFGYALELAPYLISMVRLPAVRMLCIHELISQNFGILHYNQRSYGPPGMETWDASLGYQSMPSAYVYELFGKLIGGRIIEDDVTDANRLVVERDNERRIFFINRTVNPTTVEWSRRIVGASAARFECRTLIPSTRPEGGTDEDQASAQALGRSAYPGDPLRADAVRHEQQTGDIGPKGLTLTVPSYSINLIRCLPNDE